MRLLGRHAFGCAICAAIILPSVPAFAGETTIYVYDALGRLVEVRKSGTVNEGVTTQIGYDAAGNRTDYDVTGSNGSGSDGGVTGGVGAPPSDTEETPPEDPPSFGVANIGITEGEDAVFTILKTGDVTGTYSVNWFTSDGSTEGTADYGVASGTAEFPAGVNEVQISISTIDDSDAEGQETFYLNLNGTSNGATITDAQGAANISDNDVANIAPVANGDLRIVPRCGIRELDIVANDTDQDGNTPLTVVQGSLSGDGAAFTDHHPDPNKTATRVQITAPNVASNTSYTVTYQVQDTLGATDTGTLTIEVRAFGDACET